MGQCNGRYCPMQYNTIDVEHCETKDCSYRTEGLTPGDVASWGLSMLFNQSERIKRLEKENEKLKQEIVKWKKIARAYK